MHMETIQKKLQELYGIKSKISALGTGIRGCSESIFAIVVPPHEGTKFKWMLRMAPRVSFDRWANSAHIEEFFDTTDELADYLERSQSIILMELLSGLAAEYDGLRNDCDKMNADIESLYCENQALKHGFTLLKDRPVSAFKEV